MDNHKNDSNENSRKIKHFSIALRITLFVAIYCLVWMLASISVFVMQFIDNNLYSKLSYYYDNRRGLLSIAFGVLSAAIVLLQMGIDTLKSKRRMKQWEELKKANPEWAQKKAAEDFAHFASSIEKRREEEARRKAEHEARLEKIPEPIREAQEGIHYFFNGPVPKHREKTVIIIAVIIFVIGAALALIYSN